MMTSKSDIEHWQINAKVHEDRVEEIHYITDPARNIRRKPCMKIWCVEKVLGRGSFGEIRLERCKDDGEVRAVKRIAMASTTLSEDECEKELKALLEFSKPKSRDAAVFVDFLGWFRDDSHVFLAMEYIPLGDLERNVAAHSGKIPEVEARDITEQLLSGIEIMHAESFTHRDLKPQNVLVVNGSPRWWVKLADFGLSKRLTGTTEYYTRSGTLPYMAPEILDYLDTVPPTIGYTNAVDMWAVGCIAYRLVTGVVPFLAGRSLMEYCNNKSLFPCDFLFDNEIGSSGIEFIRELLTTYPKKRPSASEALNHSWITSGPQTGKLSEDPSALNKEMIEFSGLAVSAIAYNTATHAGLKSDMSVNQSNIDSLVWDVSMAERGTLRGHSGTITTVAFSPDGNFIASASQDKTVRIWELSTGAISFTFQGHLDSVQAVIFSPDGNLVASGSRDKTVRLWNCTTKVAHSIFKGHSRTVTAIAFSPDGTLVASGSRDTKVKLWNPTTGAVRGTLKGHSNSITAIAFSLDGKKIASASWDKTIRLWDSTTRIAYITLEGHLSIVQTVIFSPDGQLVASGSRDKSVMLWDSVTGVVCSTLKGHSSLVHAISFSPDGKLIASAAARDTIIRLWDSRTGAQHSTIESCAGSAHAIAIFPDGKLAIAAAVQDKTVKLWERRSAQFKQSY